MASRMFIEDVSKITAPLRELTKQTVNFTWGREQQSAFKKLRDCLSEDNVLGFLKLVSQLKYMWTFPKLVLEPQCYKRKMGNGVQ